MTDFDDLFFSGQPEQKPVSVPQQQQQQPEDIDDLFHEQRVNRILITVYFVVQILMAAVMMLMYNREFPNPQEIYDNLVTVNAPTFSISLDETDPNYPYLVHVSGDILNANNRDIPRLIVSIEFYYQNQLLDYIDISEEHVTTNEMMSFDESYYFSSEIDEIQYTYSFDFDTAYSVMLNFSQALILGVGFLFIDRYNFKKRFKEFKSNLSSSMGKIVIGSIMVYGAMIASQFILNLLGAAETSQNEETIASMFTNDPARLIVLFLLLCVFTPILEEVIYRKVIFGWLDRRFGAPAAIVISGAIFGLMHVISYGDFIQSIPYILMGAVFGYVYHWSKKNIYVTIGVHFVNNFLAFMLYFLAVMGYGLI